MNNVTIADRRRHPRENTIESLSRDIRLMRESLEMYKGNVPKSEVEALFMRHEINHLITRIPELIAMREGLND